MAAVLLWSPVLFVFPLATTAAHLKSECTYLHPTERCWQSDMRFTHKMPNSRYLQSCKNGLNALKSYQTCLFTFFVHAKKELHCMEKLSGTITPGESDKSQLWYQYGEDEKMKKKIPVVFLCLCQKVFSSRPHWLPPPRNHCYWFFVCFFSPISLSIITFLLFVLLLYRLDLVKSISSSRKYFLIFNLLITCWPSGGFPLTDPGSIAPGRIIIIIITIAPGRIF